MDISELEQVLNLLRKNGLSEAESALVEDVMEKSHLVSSDFEMFLFPMVPPPPQLKILTTKRSPEVVVGDDCSGGRSDSSSKDEFVSLESSTTELCSSEFTNPYGIRTTTRASSRASSDRMSQFGTARDYPDFDMEDDQYWYKEKDEDYLMPPLFRGPDSSGDPGEDKFIMTIETGKHSEYQKNSNHVAGGSQSKGESDYLDFQWPISLVDDVKDDIFRKGFLRDRAFQHEGFLEKGFEDYMDNGCFTVDGVFHGDSADALRDLKLTEDNDEVKRAKEQSQTRYDTHFLTTLSNTPYCFNSISDLNDSLPNDNKSYSLEDYMQSARNTLEPDAGKGDQLDYMRSAGNTLEPDVAYEKGDADSEELVMYDNIENDYEIFHLRIVHRKNRTGFEENKDLPIILNQVIAGRYQVMEYLGSAAFSKVVQAHDLHTGIDVCLKIIKNDKDFFDQSLDEIKLLKFVNKNDPGDKFHILRLYDYFYHQEHLFIVTELLRANLYEFQKFNRESDTEPYFTLSRLQVITRQCLVALDFLHGLGIIHCDLKPENILIKSYQRCEIKVIDLGSSCFQADNLSLYVQSRSYRAPEVILGVPYDQKIDLWSLGCVLSELCSGEVLFPNEPLVMLLARVIGMFGLIDMEMLLRGQETHNYFTREYGLYHINEETNELEFVIPEESSLEDHLQISDPEFIHFIKYLLQVNPKRRPTAREALGHPWLCHS
ncbi:protein modifying enzyme [Lithospermum erythrorhizon]|uniref:Protein modifying enzyme n=1 Tax=Lithospermum erythrorhizon TaxID=34254 RepID=A0AAV3NSA3_LITER